MTETLIPGYDIVSVLGRGDTATVYHAIFSGRQPVALKILDGKLVNDPNFLLHFRQDLKAAAALNHPNIGRVYACGSTATEPYIAAELIEGESLRAILRRRVLSVDEAVEVVTQVAEGLDYAHGQGMLHRDLKPGNIMIREDGVVALVDFGLARCTRLGALTSPVLSLRRAPYVAPEVCQGREAEPRSDIYSLGIVLFEMLCGRPPFEGPDPMAIYSQHVKRPVPQLQELRGALPKRIQRVVEKALAKSPDRRYRTASDLARDLAQAAGLAPSKISRAALPSLKGSDAADEAPPEVTGDAPAPPRRSVAVTFAPLGRVLLTVAGVIVAGMGAVGFAVVKGAVRAFHSAGNGIAALRERYAAYRVKQRELAELRRAEQEERRRARLELDAIRARERAEERERKRAQEEARKAELARRAEEERRERERLAEEKRQEQARLAEERRKAEEARQAELARVAEEQRRAEEQRKAELALQAEEKRKAEEARWLAEAARKEEERRREAERKAAEQARREEERRKAEEARLAEQARLAEERLRAEEARKAEAARVAEERRKAEEQRRLEEARRAEERRAAEEARKAELARKAEEKRREEDARRAEQARLAEEKRLADEARKAEEARRAEERRRAEAARREEEQRRAEEARKAEEARLAEERRRAEEVKRAEAARQAEEKRRAEEARQAEEARRAAERRRAEAARAAEKAERDAEAKRQEEAQRRQSRTDREVPLRDPAPAAPRRNAAPARKRDGKQREAEPALVMAGTDRSVSASSSPAAPATEVKKSPLGPILSTIALVACVGLVAGVYLKGPGAARPVTPAPASSSTVPLPAPDLDPPVQLSDVRGELDTYISAFEAYHKVRLTLRPPQREARLTALKTQLEDLKQQADRLEPRNTTVDADIQREYGTLEWYRKEPDLARLHWRKAIELNHKDKLAAAWLRETKGAVLNE